MSRHIKAAGLALLLVLLAACNAAQAAFKGLQQPPLTGMVHQSGQAVLDDDIYSFQAEIAGVVYTLPFPLWKLMHHGWQTDTALSGEVLEAGEYADIQLLKGEQTLKVRLVNTGRVAVRADEAMVGEVLLEGSLTARLAGGVALGSGRTDVLAAFGVPDKPAGRESAPLLQYSLGRYAYIEAAFDEQDVLQRLRLVRYEEQETPPAVEYPPEVLQWRAPESIPQSGESWPGFVFRLSGGNYTLPCPVKALLDNGFAFVDNANMLKMIEPDSFAVGVYLRLDNQLMRVNLINRTEESLPYAACEVSMLESNLNSAYLPIMLSGGIGFGSSLSDVAQAYGDATGRYESAGLTRVIYTSETGKMRFEFENAGMPEERLISVKLENK